jgi:hypothetical protein
MTTSLVPMSQSIQPLAPLWQQSIQKTLRQVTNPSPVLKETAISGLKVGGVVGIEALGIALSGWLRKHGMPDAADITLLLDGAYTYRPFSTLLNEHLTQVSKLFKR